jgi:GntR family transcriptional regulator, arabinose operon transcriptional repressor
MNDLPGSTLPKYRQIEQFLLEEIDRGNYLPGHSFITEREVCRNFGVSRITAMRAINDLVQRGVLERRRGAGTFVRGPEGPIRQAAQGLLIGGVFQDIHGPHMLEILAGIEEVCRETNANLVVYDSASRPDWEAGNLRRARDAGVAGLIVYPVDGLGNASAFADAKLPLVMVDRYYPSLATDAVLPDSFLGARQVVGELLDSGHRRLAVVWGEVACTSVQESHAGLRRALLDRGLPLEPDLFLLTPYNSMPERSRHERLRAWLESDRPPTAFVAVNVHTLLILRSDLAALGVDMTRVALGALSNDNPAALEAMGAIGTELPSRLLGSTATRMLLDRLGPGVARPARQIVLSAGMGADGARSVPQAIRQDGDALPATVAWAGPLPAGPLVPSPMDDRPGSV